ncbi:MFS transporter [Streptomyces sp. NPDC051940]|uniref:MFS transporter n=1 Tax=Streptomyces sp. NPDC051940 TaxID=3155675 RepID=UPI00342E1666
MRPRIPDLLRERAFRRYWTGQSISLLGDEVHRIAMPLAAVLVLGADAADMGWLTAAPLLPALFLSMPAGAWADGRRSRRRIMLAADVGRFLALASIPAAYALGVLTLTQLFVVAFVIGILSVLFNVSNNTLYASLVPTGSLLQGSSLINGSRSIAFVAGPGAGGALVQVLTAPVALLADAVSYLASAFFLGRINPQEPPPAPRERGHFLAGLRWVVGTPLIRAFQLGVATLNFFNFIFHALFVLYATRELGLAPGTLGLVLGAGAVGGLAGAALTGRIVARLGYGVSIIAGCLGFSLPLVLVPLAHGSQPQIIAMLLAAEFLACFGVMVLDVSANAFQTALVPDALRSRVSGVLQTVNYGIRPLGALAGGWLGTAIGLHASLWIATVGATLGVVWLLFSPLPGMRDLPASAEPALSAATVGASA